MTNAAVKVLVTTVPVEAKGGIAALHGLFVDRQQELNLSFIRIGSASPFSEGLPRRLFRLAWQYAGFLAALVKDRSIEVVHINTAPGSRSLMRDMVLIYLSKLCGRKVVVQVHGTLEDHEVSRRVEEMTARAFSRCDKVMVFSRRDQQKIQRAMGDDGKVVTFPNAVKVSDFSGDSENLRERFSIPSDNRVVLFLARLVKEKGIYEIFDAIPSIVASFDKVTFLFAGDGPEMARMKSECFTKNLEKWVRFAGNLQYPDVVRAFATADIMALPSYSEGMPMSVLQALASGVPVVATPVGAVPDFLRNGENGFLVQPRNHRELADRILLLLQDDSLRKRMAAANIELARTQFAVDTVLDRLKAIHASL